MNPLLWLMRTKRWAQHPRSLRRVKLVLAVVAICLVVVGIEQVFGWPDWLTVDRLSAKP
jgi:hypothetical protein